MKTKNVCNDRAVARSENPGGHVVLGGDNVPPLVEIGLTEKKSTNHELESQVIQHLGR